jgi:3-hydroxymyristoyl/3-hydroxydecanoyl-(acyl carrier protein) dehydratase/1-acyl-sn-glycerol-3-phosphate acyltransferase
VFGLFPKEAFDDQVGLPPSDAERAQLAAPSDTKLNLRARPARYCDGALHLPGQMLLMIDRVTGYWPKGGKAGLGRLCAEKDVNPGEWFFKAHFFQDPVQPGSLGIEAMMQLLQWYAIERGLGAGIAHPRFEPIRIGAPMTWKYRGQVIPSNGLITIEMEITEVGEDEHGRYAVAEAWLWVDDKRIYHAKNLGTRIVATDVLPPLQGEGRGGDGVSAGASTKPIPLPASPLKGEEKSTDARHSVEETLDPDIDTWVKDHAPTWTVPALPMMSMADRLAQAARAHTGREVVGLRNVQVRRWLPIPGPVRLKTEVEGSGDSVSATLYIWRAAPNAALSRYEPVASGAVLLGTYPDARPPLFTPLADATPVESPYAAASLPHGPAFQYLKSWRLGPSGGSAVLDAGCPGVPRGALHQGLLDGITHVIPHDSLHIWSADIPSDRVAYPHHIAQFDLFEPLPAGGDIQVEARFAGFDDAARTLPITDLQISASGRLLASMRLVEALVPKGRIGSAPPPERKAFLLQRRYTSGVGLSLTDNGATRITEEDVAQSDWLAGTVAQSYGLPADLRREDRLAQIAIRDHVGRLEQVHPSAVEVAADLASARPLNRPLQRYAINIERGPNQVSVRTATPVRDLSAARWWWRERLATGPWPGEDVFFALSDQFVGDVIVEDPHALAAIRGRGCLYLANHQVGVESVLFNTVVAPLLGLPTVTIAKTEHRDSWIGRLSALCFSYPGIHAPEWMVLIERDDPQKVAQGFAEIAARMRAGSTNVLVHVDGTRAQSCRQPTTRLSAALLDLALAGGAPIVPVRFVGALPVEPLQTRLEFPLGYARQDYWLGRPILPEELTRMPYKDRKDEVLARINALGPGLENERPAAPNPKLEMRATEWAKTSGVTPESAVIYAALTELVQPSAPIQALLNVAAGRGRIVGTDAPAEWLRRLATLLLGARNEDR